MSSFESILSDLDIEKYDEDKLFHILNGALGARSKLGILRKQFFRWIIKRFAPENGIAIDMACGNGISSMALVEQGYFTVGIDNNIDYIKEAINITKTGARKACFAVMDIRKDGLAKAKADLITFLGDPTSLFEIATLERILENAKSILKTNGKILINYRNWLEIIGSGTLMRTKVKITIDYKKGELIILGSNFKLIFHLYAPFVIEYLLGRAGFISIKTEKMNLNPLLFPSYVTTARKSK